MRIILSAIFLLWVASPVFAQDEHGDSGPLVEESPSAAAPGTAESTDAGPAAAAAQDFAEPAETSDFQEEVAPPPPPPPVKKPKVKRRRKAKRAPKPLIEIKVLSSEEKSKGPASSPSTPLAQEAKAVLPPPPAIPATRIQPFNP